jgi:large exoprotein involved in heme utilization and adhesion
VFFQDGAQISASTTNSGKGGNITVTAPFSVTLSGNGSLSATALSSSQAGSITINTRHLTVRDGAQVTVSSPQGQAGNLNITANSLLLNRGTLFAETAKSDAQGGANITLSGLDLLQMDNESRISANALDKANGGNVTIDSIFIVATPPSGSHGSDITANAEEGNGGTVRITTQGLFGIQFRPNLTPKNDITVSTESPSSLPGTFPLTTPDVDPTRGLTNLPTEIVETSKQIVQTCESGGATARGENKFTITGRGGLPQSPNEIFSPDVVQDDLGILATGEKDTGTQGRGDGENSPTTHSASYSQSSIGNPPRQLVEAQGWIISPDGKVILTAQAPDATPHSPWQTPANCQVSQTAS